HIPVRWLLSHHAGLAAIRETLPDEALYDWNAMCRALAAETPWWTPGDGHGYHAITFGWLVGEVVRRISGKSLGTYFRDAGAGRRGRVFFTGLPDAQHGRVAQMGPIPLGVPSGDGSSFAALIAAEPNGVAARAFFNPPSMARGPNVPEWRRAEIPGANGQ